MFAVVIVNKKGHIQSLEVLSSYYRLNIVTFLASKFLPHLTHKMPAAATTAAATTATASVPDSATATATTSDTTCTISWLTCPCGNSADASCPSWSGLYGLCRTCADKYRNVD